MLTHSGKHVQRERKDTGLNTGAVPGALPDQVEPLLARLQKV